MRSDRWSTPSEVKRVLCPSGEEGMGGLVLYHNNGKNWVYPNEGHAILLGVSGSGKSRRGTIPMIKSFIQAGESFFVIDPKGEIYRHTATDAEGKYDIHVIDFRHIFESEHWNPLAAPYEHFTSGDPVRKQIALEMIDELAHALYPVSEKADPFWPESARSVFAGAAYALLLIGKPEQVNMAGIYQLVARGEELFGSSTVLKEFVGSLPVDSVASMLLQSYVSTASDTRAGIRSTFLEGISMFARSEGLISMLSADDLHINGLDGETRTAIYCVLPDESPIYDGIAGILCNQIMGHYIRLAQDKFDGKLPRRLNVCLEELSSIGNAIGSLDHLMSASRSRNVRCHLVLQSLSQLDTLYGPSKASTIRSNADVLVAFRTNHWETLCELSHKCGEREIEGNNHVSRESLITPSQLAAMKTGQALVMISGHIKFITWLPDFTEMFDCSEWKAPKRIVRKGNTTVEVFNIKEYVQEVKKKRMLEGMSEDRAVTQKPVKPSPTSPPRHTTSSLSSKESDPPDTTSCDIDSLISKIDAKIAELEAELEAENATEKNKKESTSKIKSENHEVILLAVENSSLATIKAIIREHTKIESKQVREIVNNLPHTFTFRNEQNALQFLSHVSDAGAIAILGVSTDEEEDKKIDASLYNSLIHSLCISVSVEVCC